MTLIEFHDQNEIENICACLTYRPERMYLIGHSAEELEQVKPRYEKILAGWNIQVEIQCKPIRRTSLRNAVELLAQITEAHDDCVFGLTGGEEVYLTAVGILRGQHPEKPFRLHRFNIEEGKVLEFSDSYGVERILPVPDLCVQENIRIYGGDLVQGDVVGDATYDWDVTDELVADAQDMWAICREQPWEWNAQISVFAEALLCGKFFDGGLTVSANINELRKRDCGYRFNKQIIQDLLDAELLTACYEEEGQLIIRFKDLQTRRCLSKAGQVLELRVYLNAMELAEKDEYVYGDIINGAFIDWDGVPHDERKQNIYDTENEIDILLMRGMLPVFISCKNGKVTPEELYKLHSVARRFGGKYARMVLVATSIPRNASGYQLRQRAADMDIRIIEDVKDMTDEQLSEQLAKCWKRLTREEKQAMTAVPVG